jgi:hypothetical protein
MQHGMMMGQTPMMMGQMPMMMGQMPMMMGQMPMMMGRPGAGPDADKMMAMCMEHMQAMSGPQGGVAPPQTPAR